MIFAGAGKIAVEMKRAESDGLVTASLGKETVLEGKIVAVGLIENDWRDGPEFDAILPDTRVYFIEKDGRRFIYEGKTLYSVSILDVLLFETK